MHNQPLHPNQVTFLVHGLFEGPHPADSESVTNRLFNSILQYFPGSPIIFSTWSNYKYVDFFDALDPSVEVVLSEDPGAPSQTTLFEPLYHSNNINRHIASCQAGLSLINTPYVCRLRPDFIFSSSKLLDIYSRRCLKRRPSIGRFLCPILSLTHGTVSTHRRLGHARYPFHPSDMMHFGTLQDISSLWSAPLMEDKDFAYYLHHHRGQSEVSRRYDPMYLCRFLPEQYLFTSYLRRYSLLDDDQFIDMCDKPSMNFARSRSLIMDSFVFAGFSQIGLYWHKEHPYIRSVPFNANKTIYIGQPRHHFSKYFPNIHRSKLANIISNLLLAIQYCLDVLLVIVGSAIFKSQAIVQTQLIKYLRNL